MYNKFNIVFIAHVYFKPDVKILITIECDRVQ
jgi:hypothetical protein